jgi:3-oxoacyl-[acyl-carrier protein] reductase
MFDFKDQRVIVTGGTRGIGRGITEAFLKAGATVLATYARNHQAAENFKAEMGELGENLHLYSFDVSKGEEVDQFFTKIEEQFSSIEVLVNNSGIRKDSLMATMPDEDWQQVIDINLSGTFMMSKRAVMTFMSNRYGRIVNISSVGGSLGLPGQTNYAASKAGQVALSKSLSKEVGRKGITINNVCPGFIETELIADLPADQVKEYKKQVPVRRFGTTEEVARGVLFLASKESSYISGASLEITGGL